ncbi:MAG: hypothetical protein ACYS8Z_25830 [Planctomycetota bacterium]|jgi:hypothetical protein
MGFTTSNPVSEDNATKADDYDVVFDNTIALKERRGQLELGGDYTCAVDDTSFVDIPGVVHAQVDGSNFSGLTVECHFMCKVATGTGTFRLYNVTATAEVASSQKTFTNSTADRIVTSALTLASASNEYKAQVKGATAADLPRIWDAQIVIR